VKVGFVTYDQNEVLILIDQCFHLTCEVHSLCIISGQQQWSIYRGESGDPYAKFALPNDHWGEVQQHVSGQECEERLVERVQHFQEFELFTELLLVFCWSVYHACKVIQPNEGWCFEREQLYSDECWSGDEITLYDGDWLIISDETIIGENAVLHRPRLHDDDAVADISPGNPGKGPRPQMNLYNIVFFKLLVLV